MNCLLSYLNVTYRTLLYVISSAHKTLYMIPSLLSQIYICIWPYGTLYNKTTTIQVARAILVDIMSIIFEFIVPVAYLMFLQWAAVSGYYVHHFHFSCTIYHVLAVDTY